MKKIATFLICIMVSMSLIGCGSSNSNESSEASEGPTDLTGTWDTENNDGSYMEAVIEGEVISVDWISDNGETKSIYWIGTYVAPEENTKDYTWTSKRDDEAIGHALLASDMDEKEFTYDGDSISTDVSMMGTTKTMHFYQVESGEAEKIAEPEESDEPEEKEELEEDTETAKQDTKSDGEAFQIGDTWTVDGQWSFTIDSVNTTDERNEFDDSDPKQVIIINYSYENLGYEDQNGIWNGLYIDPANGTLVDADGNVCNIYPADITYPQETPVDAKCSAQCAYGLMSDGNTATLTFSVYDGNGVEQEAKYDLTF